MEKKSFIIKEGRYSIILGNGYYGEFLNNFRNKNMQVNPLFIDESFKYDEMEYNDEKEDINRLIKITHKLEYDNEYLFDKLRNIDGIQLYFSFPEKDKYPLYPKSMLYNFITSLKFNNYRHEMIIKEYDLYYSFINNEGNYDLHNIIFKIVEENDISIWKDKTRKKMDLFIKHMLDGLEFLHTNKIVHLDIKPENIMYNDIVNYSISNFGLRFKIIDFGFAAAYPFKEVLYNIKGTQGYIPIYYNKPDEFWLPPRSPNDWQYGKHISLKFPDDERYSILKSDIYSFGRTIYYLDYLLDEKINSDFYVKKCCSCFNRRNVKKYDNLMIVRLTDWMTEEKIENRYSVKLCIRFVCSNF